ncbi:MAG: hypothetical protein H6R15_1183 [Proteobacteria bacterium]|nr:hypothetical protein [Pseudomonadota bacterium]
MKVLSLEAPLLNFWVAKSAGLKPVADGRGAGSISVMNPDSGELEPFQPSIDWSQAGPILADQWYELEGVLIEWLGPLWPHLEIFRENSLVWFMRAFVVLRFGEEVEELFSSDEQRPVEAP